MHVGMVIKFQLYDYLKLKVLLFLPETVIESVTLRMDNGDNIVVGEDVVLYCDIELTGVMRGSDVTVDVSWFRDSIEVINGTRIIISDLVGNATGATSTVTISPVCLSDSGIYVCNVTVRPVKRLFNTLTASGSHLLAPSGERM